MKMMKMNENEKFVSEVGRKSLTSTLAEVVEADEKAPFLEILSPDNMRPPEPS